ncbi:MAG: hypothetical protein ACP5UV_04535, partial [Thermoplasmata archaeon]
YHGSGGSGSKKPTATTLDTVKYREKFNSVAILPPYSASRFGGSKYIEENRGISATDSHFSPENTDKKAVAGSFSDPLPKPMESKTQPSKSDARNERPNEDHHDAAGAESDRMIDHGITEEDGRILIERLRENNFTVDPDSGLSIDGSFFKIGIVEKEPDRISAAKAVMTGQNFIQITHDDSPILWFRRRLKSLKYFRMERRSGYPDSIVIEDTFQDDRWIYIAVDPDKNDLNSRAWNMFALESAEISRNEYQAMRGGK